MRDNYNDLIDFLKQFTPKGNEDLIPIRKNSDIRILPCHLSVGVEFGSLGIEYSNIETIVFIRPVTSLRLWLKDGNSFSFSLEEHSLYGDIPLDKVSIERWRAIEHWKAIEHWRAEE